MDGRDAVIVAVVAALLTVFGIAVVGKLRAGDRAALTRAARGLWIGRRPLSVGGARRIAIVVVTTEAAVVLALAVGGGLGVLQPARPWALPGLLGAAALLAAFVVAQLVALRRGRVVPCACFGRATDTAGPVALVRNVILLAAAVVAALAPRFADTGGASVAVAALQALAGAFVAVLLVELEGIVTVFRPFPGAGTRAAGGRAA